MIRLMIAALWISIATTGALVFSFQWGQASYGITKKAEDNFSAFDGMDFVRTGIISVPVFKKGHIDGYFLARLVFTADGSRLAELKLPPEALLADQVYSYLYANPEIDFARRDNFDADSFRASIRNGINKRLGEPLLQEVLIEQIDYLSKNEVEGSKVQHFPASPSLEHS